MRRAAVAALVAAVGVPAVASAQSVMPTPSRDAETRIIGGTPADREIIGASLQFSYQGDPNFHYCGGVPITRRHVLTAAHCFRAVLGLDNSAPVTAADEARAAAG